MDVSTISKLDKYRSSPSETESVEDFFLLLAPTGRYALDIAARDCHLSRIMAERFKRVFALDLDRPEIEHACIEPVEGNNIDWIHVLISKPSATADSTLS
jgi:2-polyprenyl-3-methyl-5-hydroxy-6-metoxy-1,4-benzoquinol methylase